MEQKMINEPDVYSHSFAAFDSTNNFHTKKVWIKDWKKQNGDFIKKGEKLADMEIRGNYKNGLGSDKDGMSGFFIISAHALTDGYLEILKEERNKSENLINDGEKLFIVHPKLSEELRIKKFSNVPDIIIDEFKGTKEIKWECVAGRRKKYVFSDAGNSFFATGELNDSFIIPSGDNSNNKLIFTINNIDNKDFVVLRYPTQDYKLTIGDKFSFLFTNGDILQFIIMNKPHKHSKHFNWGPIFETRIQLTTQELETLKNIDFSKWQIEFAISEKKILGTVDADSQFAIKKFAKEYCELVQSEIKNYQPLKNKQEPKTELSINDENCYVYLMIDINNNYHKIGISNKPEWREQTLQSEKPTIELIASKKFVSRKIASSIEKALHNSYADKRIRGEWFQLDTKDIQEIKITLTT